MRVSIEECRADGAWVKLSVSVQKQTPAVRNGTAGVGFERRYGVGAQRYGLCTTS